MGMSEISRNVYLSEIKAPAGCFLTKGSFSEHTPDELIHFCYDLKKWLFPIFVFLVTFYGIRSLFYRKPKWSVWSIWTYSTGWILKFVTQKVSYGRKLKKWKSKIGKSKIKKIENFKCSDFEFYNEIGSSGPSHSIRLVELVSKKKINIFPDDFFGPKLNFYIKNIDFPSLLSGCPGFI